MHRHTLLTTSLIVTLALLGAGCGSNDTSRSASSNPQSEPAGTSLQASIPSDISIYPGSTVIASSGYNETHTVATLTSISANDLKDWVRREYAAKGTLKSTSQTGMSTEFIFENPERIYRLRVDNPPDGNGSFLTVTREKNAQ